MKSSQPRHLLLRAATALAVVALTATISSCGGGNTGDSADVTLTAAASAMTPPADGFAFANFGSANTKETMNGEDMRLMFGDGVCSNGTASPCQLTAEAAAWVQMVNQSRESGHCEGMVVQAASRFTTSASPKTPELTNVGDTTHGIIRAFATQFFPAVKKETDVWATKSLKEILAALGESFAAGKVTYTMGLYSDQGGHAVLPLSVEYPDPDTAKVHIYDTNWPGSDRYVMFDLKKNEWRFSFAGVDPENDPSIWTGGKGDIDMASLDTRTGATVPFGSSDNAVKGNFLVIRSTALNWKVKTSEGDLTAASGGVMDTSVRPLRAANMNSLPEYVVSTTSTDIDLVLPDAASVYVVSAKKVVHITTGGSAAPIVMKENKVVTSDAAARISVAAKDFAATVIGIASDITVSDTSLLVTADGVSQPVLVDAKVPQVTVTARGGKLVTTPGSDIVAPTATLPNDLIQPDTKPGLPPQDQRTLATAPSTTTTTTTAPISTVSPTTTVKSTNTTVKTSTTTSTVTSTTPTTAPPTTVAQSNIVALQYYSNGGSLPTMINGYSIPTLSFKLINTNNQWDTSGTGDCSAILLPETNAGSLNGASLSGSTLATASGGVCSFNGMVINGTSGTKYRIKVSLSNSTATTTLGPFTLY